MSDRKREPLAGPDLHVRTLRAVADHLRALARVEPPFSLEGVADYLDHGADDREDAEAALAEARRAVDEGRISPRDAAAIERATET